MDAPRIDITYCRESLRGVGHVVIIHDIVSQVLRLSLCSDVLDGRGPIIPVVIGQVVITGSIHWRELMISQLDECL